MSAPPMGMTKRTPSTSEMAVTTRADITMLSGPAAMKPRWPMPAMAPSSSTALMT
jgi:hypothetical protein